MILNLFYRNLSPITLRYDASLDVWMVLSSIPRPATIGSTAVLMGEHILITGGMHVGAETRNNYFPELFTGRSFIYSIRTNTWKEMSAVPHAVVAHASCFHNGLVYVAGGFRARLDISQMPPMRELTNKVYAYDIKGKIWLVRPPLIAPRCNFTLDEVSDRIYAIGGQTGDNSDPDSMGHIEDTIEMYDPYAEQWTVLEPRIQVTMACSIQHEGCIYILGGIDYGAEPIERIPSSSKKIVKFSPSTGQVDIVGKDSFYFPCFSNNVTVCMITPNHIFHTSNEK